jgi:hypothetical protein
MAYCTNDDLAKIRPRILEMGVTDWADQIAEAERQIDRVVEARWYRKAATERGLDWRATPFDKTKLADGGAALKRLACYKTLELAYEYLMTESPEASGFERQRDYFHEAYERELKEVLGAGLDYDWGGDDQIQGEEKSQVVIRTLTRC